MPTCVSENTYLLVFILGISAIICFLLSTVYFYDKFNKASVDILNKKQANTAKSISMIFMTVAIIFLCVMFIVFFGFSKKITYNIH